MYEFNLIHEKWIPVILRDGRNMELSIYEVLERAGEVRKLQGSPLVSAALHRFLLAILHRNFGPQTRPQWLKIWNAREFDMKVLSAYFSKWNDRFDLFHGKHPFYQVAGFSTKRESPVARLFHELSSGNNQTLFDHSYDETGYSVSPAQAARGLVVNQAFALGGGRSETTNLRDAPLAKKMVVLFSGNNLFETLMFNLIRYSASDSIPIPGSANDRPNWERDDSLRIGERRLHGYLDLLTWQSRCIRLIPEFHGGVVKISRINYAQGEVLMDTEVSDPQCPMYRHERLGWRPLQLQPERVLWRDSTALFRVDDVDMGIKAIDASRWLSEFVIDNYIPDVALFKMSVYGMSTSQARIDLWRHEELPLSVAYLVEKELVEQLQSGLDFAESVHEDLRSTLYILASCILVPPSDSGERKPDRAQINQYSQSFPAHREYWSRLEVPFLELLDALPCLQGALEQWQKTVAKTAIHALDHTILGLQQSARTLRAAVTARRVLFGKLSAKRVMEEGAKRVISTE